MSSCRRSETSALDAVAVQPSGDVSPVESAVAAVVNGEKLLVSEVSERAREAGVAEAEALKSLVAATVVLQEARRQGHVVASSDRVKEAHDWLNILYSETTLCDRISEKDISALYEFSYHPDWPADVYSGMVAEVRCCSMEKGDCGSAAAKDCFGRGREVLSALAVVANGARGGSDLQPGVMDTTAGPVTVTDFGLLDWPGIPQDRQNRKRLFDQTAREKIVAGKEGDLIGPFESSVGFHLVKLQRIRRAITAQDNGFRTEARAELCRRRVEQTRTAFVQELLKYAVIKYEK